jgi:uncharacterized protein
MRSLRNLTRQTLVAAHIGTAATPWRRTIGLLGRGVLDADDGLAFPRCNRIHTIGMRVPLDVIFLDASGEVLRFVHGAHPNRFQLSCDAATSVIEIGTAAEARVAVGDVLGLGD